MYSLLVHSTHGDNTLTFSTMRVKKDKKRGMLTHFCAGTLHYCDK